MQRKSNNHKLLTGSNNEIDIIENENKTKRTEMLSQGIQSTFINTLSYDDHIVNHLKHDS